MEIALFSVRKLSHLEFADDVVILSEDSSKLEIFPDCLNDIVGKFGMSFGHWQCKTLLRD